MITPSQIKESLVSWGIEPGCSQFTDDSYRCPTRSWLIDRFGPSFRTLCDRIGYRYRTASQDCDDFTLLALSYARLLHAETRGSGETGIAFGYFSFWRADAFVKHAMNIAIVDEGNELVPVWFEPQTGLVSVLAQEERTSCGFYLF